MLRTINKVSLWPPCRVQINDFRCHDSWHWKSQQLVLGPFSVFSSSLLNCWAVSPHLKRWRFRYPLLRILRTLKVSRTRDWCKLNGVWCCLVVDLENLVSEVRENAVPGWITPEMSFRIGFMKNSNQSEDWLSCFAHKQNLHTLSLWLLE